ncbi:hypothetical protein FBY35_2703 [Streptomyces sp. SLBN-118]|uniref:hypothetical protein n=1 Tax=Streptomyces sp. SLBN-118 TaxID=2768454 RepID=UPI0011530962|nr:hypothetical protein [Streptomyces sp. SLBN-118]TQK52272.1 hypothetical protein FBY35_2703 [Streptomyces sp. SLBN-118]
MARHTAPQSRRLTLLRAGLTVAAVAAALGAGEAAAHAAPTAPAGLDVLDAGQTQGLTGAVTNSVAGAGQLKRLPLDPLAKTGVDPLDNGVATQVADFKPVGTTTATGHVTRGQAIEDLPVVGGASGLLPF